MQVKRNIDISVIFTLFRPDGCLIQAEGTIVIDKAEDLDTYKVYDINRKGWGP